jgi:DNA polymerase
LDESHRRAWQALGIGPVWRLRDVSGAGDAGGAEAPHGDPEALAIASAAPAAAPATPGPGTAARGEAPGVDDTTGDVANAPAERLSWPLLERAVAACTACGLCRTRTNTVFGVGPQRAPWMLVGEAPGEQEDLRGEPFVGPAGRLLDEMLAAIGVDRPTDAFIANVLKCRPPGNRNPLPEEVARCEPFLARQVALLQPRLVVALGRFAAQSLLRTDASIASLRGRIHRVRIGERELPLVVTYHPAYLLRTLPDKAKAWADLRLARRTFDALAD